jgi:uncharacterized protein YkwD
MRILSSLFIVTLLAPTFVLAADVPAQDLLNARPDIIEYIRGQRPLFTAAILKQQAALIALQQQQLRELEEEQGKEKEQEVIVSEREYPDISAYGYTPSPLEKELIDLFNAERAKVGSPALQFHSLIQGAARRHSEDMNTADFFSHQGSDQSTTENRVKDSGYTESCECNYKFGEILADGANSANHAVQLWLESPPHRKILLDSDYVHVGIYKDGSFWTGVFGMLALP